MGRDRSRVLILLVAYLACLVVGTLVMSWFVADFQGLDDRAIAQALDTVRMSLGLHEATVCRSGMPCASFSFSNLGRGLGLGWYGTFAAMTLWGGIAVAVLITFQVFTRLRSGVANVALTRLGYFGCVYVFAAAACAGYAFAPDSGSSEAAAVVLTVNRTWAPALTLLAQILGMVVLHHAATEGTDDEVPPYVPVVVAPPADRSNRVTTPPSVARTSSPDRPARISTPPSVARTSSQDRPARISTPPSVARTSSHDRPVVVLHPPAELAGKLSFATGTAEITRGGIDARREDGSARLVMWGDVVGVVARRLPPEYGGSTFIDLVSNAGSTLRVLPWTRLSGDPVWGEGDAHARSLIALVVDRCPAAALDPATRAFLEGKDAAQLPDLATLAAHDQRLA